MNTLRIVACATLFGAAHAALGDFSASHAPPDTLAPDWNFMTDDASVTYHVEPATYGINTADINAKIYYAGDLGDKYGYKITNSSFWVPGITAADLKGAIILAMRGGGNYAGKAASAQALGAAASITMQSDPNAMQTTMFFIAPKVHIPSFIVDVATGAKIKAQMVTFSYTWAAGASGKPAAATIAANAARKIALDALLATATSAANWEECSRLAAQIANVGPITATGTCAAYNAATGCTGSTKSAGRTFSLTGSTAAAASDITALANMYKSFDALPTATARATWKIGQWGPYNLKGTNTSDWKPLEAEITTAGSVKDVCGIAGNKLWGIWCEGGRVTRIMVGGGGAGFVGGKWALTAAAVNGLTGLKKLYLASASLINALPTGMTALPELVMFDVHNNADLTGEVPAGIGLHTKLKQLDLLNCKFTGIHADVGDATALTQIYASKNSITSFPAKVQIMPNLIILSAADNKITSFAFETTSKLKYLDISGNGIVGALPSFAGATQLIDVKLSGNKFTGNPSAAFNNCPQLKTVNVADNMLTGTAPILTGSPKVVSLDFSQNKLAAFPDEWILAPPAALATITMNNNLVISPVKALVNLPKLATLNLAHNKLSSLADGAPAGHNAKTFIEWTVPESIVSLDLSHNLIDGIMCPNGGSYAACTYKNGYLRNLQTLDMSNNPLLQGTLGEEYLTTMSSPVLKSMNFENCDLSGALPDPGTNMQKTPITINVKNNTKMTWGAGAALPGWVTQGGLKQAPGAKFSCPELFHLGALVGIDSSYYGSTLCVCGRGFWGPGNQCQDFPSVATATTATAGKVSDDFNSANAQPHERLSKGITTDFPIRVPAGTGNTTVLAIEATIDTSKMLSTESLQVRYKDAKGKEQFLVAKFNATVDSVPGGCKIVPGAAAAVVCYALGTDITAKFTSPLTDNAVSFTIDYKALTSCPAGSTILEVNAVTKKSSCVQPKVSLTAEFTLDGVSTRDIGADGRVQGIRQASACGQAGRGRQRHSAPRRSHQRCSPPPCGGHEDSVRRVVRRGHRGGTDLEQGGFQQLRFCPDRGGEEGGANPGRGRGSDRRHGQREDERPAAQRRVRQGHSALCRAECEQRLRQQPVRRQPVAQVLQTRRYLHDAEHTLHREREPQLLLPDGHARQR
jgi:Leucine-rich repeat (LRR) protein